MIRVLFLTLALASVVVLPGCASSGSQEDEYSSVPWNRPEKWEGQGPVGGMMNTY